jgi:iron complex outermembrane recepter protein
MCRFDRSLLAGVSIMALSLAATTTAQAQEQAGQTPPVQTNAGQEQDETSSLDDVIVTGIRRSIADAISAKRNSDVLMDTISAEDIGKLPDQNVTETLSRIPGVQISRVEGAGQQISVRGIDLNRLQLNGNSFIGSATNGDPNLADISPELLGSVEIIKAPAADLVEGWLGAIINLRTKRPLDYREPIIAGRVQGSYADQAEDFGYKASGVLSRRFLDDAFGALVGFSYAESSGRSDLYNSGGWTRATADVNGDGIVDTFFRPNRLQTNVNTYEDQRWALNGTLQWRPMDGLTFTLDGLKSRRDAERYRFAQQTILNNNITNGVLSPSGTLLSGNFSGVTLRPLIYSGDSWAESSAVSFGAEYAVGSWLAHAHVSRSEGTSLGRNAENNDNSPGNDNVLVARQIAGNTVNATYNTQGSDVSPDYGLTSNFNMSDPSQYEIFASFDAEYPNENSGEDADFDLQYEANWGPLRFIKIGARTEDVSVFTAQADVIYPAFSLYDPTPGTTLRANEVQGLNYFGSITDIFRGQGGSFPRTVLAGTADPDVFRQFLHGAGPDLNGNTAKRSIRDIDITTNAAFIKFSFEGDILGVPYSGNLGVRQVEVDRTSSGFDLNVATNTIVPRSVTTSSSHTLPSGNLILRPRDDLTVRFGAAAVTARPRLNDTGVGVLLNAVNGTGSGGNPLLEPYEANQYDISVEWYFAPASLLSVALFKKDVGTFISEQVAQEVFDLPRNGLPVGDPNRFTYDITRPVNGTDASIEGIEINYQQSLSMLPAPFDGLGYALTYTYADTQTDVVDPLTGSTLPLPNSSQNSANVIAYYEAGPFSARIAYNWRDEYLLTRQGVVNGGSRFNAGRGQLDASASWKVNDTFTVNFEAVNLTKEINTQYVNSPERLNDSFLDDRRVYLGLSASF